MKPNPYLIAGGIVLLVVAFLLGGSGKLGGLDSVAVSGNSTGTLVSVTNTGSGMTRLLAEKSGRLWFRITNVSTSSLFSCVLTYSTSGYVYGAGIWLGTSTPVFDSGQSAINWEGPVWCAGNATGSVATYEK